MRRSETHALAPSRRTRKCSPVVSASRSRAPNRVQPCCQALHHRPPRAEIWRARDSSSNETAHFNHESARVEATACQIYTHEALQNHRAEILTKFEVQALSFHLHKHNARH